MSKLIIGLTGGIGSGKSTVADIFATFGIDIIDADIIARSVVEPNTAGFSQIVEYFGQQIINANGQLDRAKLRNIVFNSAEKQQWLNGLLHPLIRQKMIEESQQAGSVYCLLVVPLLLENNLNYLVNKVLVTDCKPETQICRASHRDNNSAEQIKQIMQAQLDRETRLNYADDVIDTEQTLAQVKQQCIELHQRYLKLAKL